MKKVDILGKNGGAKFGGLFMCQSKLGVALSVCQQSKQEHFHTLKETASAMLGPPPSYVDGKIARYDTGCLHLALLCSI